MSLYGALFSGVSGLTAQSSAMGAISDNITNVSTIGYKNTRVDFQTLVTKQTSVTFYSAGGVQSRPRAQNDVQGLLQSSTSQTDMSISGSGFFVVNENPEPTISNEYLYTRAGSFIMDDQGYLKNAAGYYLQAWPTDAAGNVIPANDSLSVANQNIVSSDYLETVNLNRVGGTAAATSKVEIGANLPANASTGDTQKTDVQYFDSLGNAHSISLVYTKTSTPNEWDVSIQPPSGTTVLNAYDQTGGGSGDVYQSVGQLEFDSIPDNGTNFTISNGTTTATYTFSTTATTGVDNSILVGGSRTIAQVVDELVTEINADFSGLASIKTGDASSLVLTGNTSANYTVAGLDTVTTSGTASTKQGKTTTGFQVDQVTQTGAGITFNSDGLPQSFNLAELEILDYQNGASNMDGAAGNSDRIALDFGTPGEANGMTQFGADFTPIFINQNGSKFGTYAGVSIGTDGLVTALFDNGETRTIYKIPVATFVNPNELESRTGNVWNATEASGDYTLREPDNGPAGQVIQSALEGSTVDIGEEFTNMIVVQRAYSASTKIIRTADQMLDELMQVK